MSAPTGPDHVGDELPAFINGELDRDQTRLVAAHLRTCLACQDDLVSVATATSALRSARRAVGPEPVSRAEPPADLDVNDVLRPRRWSVGPPRRLVALAVAVIIVIAGSITVAQLASSSGGRTIAHAVLRPLQAPRAAGGEVAVTAEADTRTLTVHATDLPPAGTNRFYEVWLLDPSTNKMLPMGALAPSGRSEYAVPAPIMSGYSAVDISLQTNDGNPAHSKISVLRAIL